jgi:hypothetical protein
LPSTASVGRSTPVAAPASTRNARSQAAKHARNASGRNSINTRWKTSLPGTPCGSGKTATRSSSFKVAHRAIAVGPVAPANTAINAMTTTEARGCRRLIEDRGSSNSGKWTKTSSNPSRCESAIAHPPCIAHGSCMEDGLPETEAGRKLSKFAKSTHKYALALLQTASRSADIREWHKLKRKLLSRLGL